MEQIFKKLVNANKYYHWIAHDLCVILKHWHVDKIEADASYIDIAPGRY